MGIFGISSHTNKSQHPRILKHLLLGRWSSIKPKIKISWLEENQHETGQGWIPMDPKYPLEHLGGSWIHREGAGWEFGITEQPLTWHWFQWQLQTYTKFFQPSKSCQKRVGRGEDFKIYYIREEFPLSRAVTQKKKGGGERRQKLEQFYHVCGLFFFYSLW